MKAYIFSQKTNYGEFVRIVIADSVEEAFNMSDKYLKPLKDNGWDIILESEVAVKDTETKRIVFEGGGSL